MRMEAHLEAALLLAAGPVLLLCLATLCVLETGLLPHNKPTGVTYLACWADDQRSAEGSAGTFSPCPQDVYSTEILAGSQASVLQIKRSPKGMCGEAESSHM